jgi:hypothetical protein
VNAYRQRIIKEIEDLAAALSDDGRVTEWFQGLDTVLAKACGLFVVGAACNECASHACIQATCEINGPLMRQLVGITRFEDPQCVEQFRTGFALADMLPKSSHYADKRTPAEISLEQLLLVRGSRNRETVGKLKMDAKAAVLMKKTSEDARLHRMSEPRQLRQEDFDTMCLSPRFSVLQGRHPASRVSKVAVAFVSRLQARRSDPVTTSLCRGSMRQQGRKKSYNAIPLTTSSG